MPGLSDLPKNFKLIPKGDFCWRLWQRDPSLFSGDEEDYPAILNRMGWLEAPQESLARVDEMEQFAKEAQKEGFKTAVLLGMGGSSLCPLVFSQVFKPDPGFLRLKVIDTTSPAFIRDFLKELDPASTLFIVSSKSGKTVETLSLYHIFRERCPAHHDNPGGNFVAITDHGSPLAEMARQEGFRKIFLAPSDVGGRYSALTVFGMLPATLMGLNVRKMLQKVQDMIERSGPGLSVSDNPGVALGTWIAEQAKSGRDKLTLLISPLIEPLAFWVEQLLAESTGKNGLGVIPIIGEQPGEPEEFGEDRCFVHVHLAGEEVEGWPPEVLRSLGGTVFSIEVESILDLGAEFFRWEMATAAVGFHMGINPFDEPNVAESKENTRSILDEYVSNRAFPCYVEGIDAGGTVIFPPDGLNRTPGKDSIPTAGNIFNRFLDLSRPGDYLSIMAYLPYKEGFESSMGKLKRYVRNRKHIASTFGYGPRYLHSTGQIHKGGAATGLYLFITQPEEAEVSIPGKPYTLGELHTAQALGDERALRNRGRRVLRAHLQKGSGAFDDFIQSILNSQC